MDAAAAADMDDAIRRAMRMFLDKPAWRRLQRRGMKQSFAWASSAAKYEELYLRLLGRTSAASRMGGVREGEAFFDSVA
jgi:starch synthase